MTCPLCEVILNEAVLQASEGSRAPSADATASRGATEGRWR
jgi:hypothetical protein